MSDRSDVMFNVNAPNVRLKNFIPKHGKAEDAVRSAELQFSAAAILPLAAAALLLGGEDPSFASPGLEVEASFFLGDHFTQRFWGIEEVACGAKFKARHKIKIEDLKAMRCTLVEKIRLRFEGGPQRLIWADFSVHIEDPSAEEVLRFHELLNRDVKVQLTQSADLIDEMRSRAQGMAVTTVENNGELFDENGQKAGDADALAQVADTLEEQDAQAAKEAGRKRSRKTAKTAKKTTTRRKR